MINFNEYLDAVVSITNEIEGFDEWTDDKKLDFYTGLAKILTPPTVELRDIFDIKILPPSECVEFPLDVDIFVADK